MDESTNSAGESPPGNDTKPDAGESKQPGKNSQLEQIAELLAPPKPDDKKVDGEGGSEKPGESDKGKPKTINDFAEMHGVDVKDLYAMQFNFGDGEGESKTLSELKDIAGNANQFAVDQLRFEEQKTKRETEFVRAQSELQDLVNMLPKKAVTPELLQVIANKRAGIVERENGLTLSAIPEWNDDDRQKKDRNEMREHLSTYGFAPGYLDSVTDHKTLKYIRDNMQRQQRIDRVLEQVKQVNKPGHKPSSKPSPGKKAPARTGGKIRQVEAQTAAVAELLKTGTK